MRNHKRHQVIPVLEEQVNAQAVRHMNEAMEQIRGLQDYMEMQTEQASGLRGQTKGRRHLHLAKPDTKASMGAVVF